MKIEHDSYFYKKVEFPDLGCAENRALDIVVDRMRMYEQRHEEYMHLMQAVAQSTNAQELQSLCDKMGRIATAWFNRKDMK